VKYVFLIFRTILGIKIVVLYHFSTTIDSIVKNKLGEIQTRPLQKGVGYYDKLPSLEGIIKREMLFDISPMLTKPLLMKTVSLSTSNTRYALLDRIPIATDLFSNLIPSLKETMKNYAMFRMYGCFYITLNGTINHQGIVLASFVPQDLAIRMGQKPDFVTKGINILLTCPHAFLGANEASSVCVEVPFWVPTDLKSVGAIESSNKDIDLYAQTNYGSLMLVVMNPLATGASSSTGLDITVQFKIDKLELYVPRPSVEKFEAQSFTQFVTNTFDDTATVAKKITGDLIDTLRAGIKSYTGLHNPNSSNVDHRVINSTRNFGNNIDIVTRYEKLDPNANISRVADDFYFNTDIDEMSMRHILSKPQYIGSFKVNQLSGVGTRLFSRPISPYQGALNKGLVVCNNIELLYLATRAWRGDMELVIQSSMTNKQNVKLLVYKSYDATRNQVTSETYPHYDMARAGIYTYLEFSGGNQQLVVDLDFLAKNQLMYNTLDWKANYAQHGNFHIYIAQSLAVAEGVPQEIEFNVYLRCKDNFRFYGYSTNTFDIDNVYFNNFEAESSEAPVMNAPTEGKPLTKVEEKPHEMFLKHERLSPLTDIRPLIRRMQYAGTYSGGGEIGDYATLKVSLRELIGRSNSTGTSSMLRFINLMYLGIIGGVKIKALTNNNIGYVTYYPPTVAMGDTQSRFVAASIDPVIPVAKGPDPTPFQEFSAASNTTTDINDPSKKMIQSVYEFEIPFTSIYKWWGSFNYVYPDQSYLLDPVNDLGNLLFVFKKQPDYAFAVQFYVSFNDETRLGFHTNAPIIALPTTSNGLNITTMTVTNTGGTSPIPSIIPGPLYYSNLQWST